MSTLNAHSSALLILDKVLEGEVPIDQMRLYFMNRGVGTNNQGETVKTEVFFIGVGPDIYVVNLYGDGGEVQHLKASDSWSVFPSTQEEESDVSED